MYRGYKLPVGGSQRNRSWTLDSLNPSKVFTASRHFKLFQDFENSFKIDIFPHAHMQTLEKTPEYVKCVKDLV